MALIWVSGRKTQMAYGLRAEGPVRRCRGSDKVAGGLMLPAITMQSSPRSVVLGLVENRCLQRADPEGKQRYSVLA